MCLCFRWRTPPANPAPSASTVYYGTRDSTRHPEPYIHQKDGDSPWTYDQYKMNENVYASIQDPHSPPPRLPLDPHGPPPRIPLPVIIDHHCKNPDHRPTSPAPPYSTLETSRPPDNHGNAYTDGGTSCSSGGSRQYFVLDTAHPEAHPE